MNLTLHQADTRAVFQFNRVRDFAQRYIKISCSVYRSPCAAYAHVRRNKNMQDVKKIAPISFEN